MDTHGLRPKLRLNTTVTGCRFDEANDIWHVGTGSGELTSRFIIAGIGGLEVPNLPDIAGIDSFGGTVLHTAAWDHSVDLRGRRIGVIGTGASALQLIPEVAKVASHLTVFQRTPIWVAPSWIGILAGSPRRCWAPRYCARRCARSDWRVSRSASVRACCTGGGCNRSSAASKPR